MTALSLYHPDAAQPTQPDRWDDPRRGLTLRQCYDEFLRPELEQHSRRSTRSAYETALRHWEALTDDPPVGVLDQVDEAGRLRGSLLLADWQQGMAARVASPETIRKYRRHLTTILRRIGPYERGNPQAVGVLTRLPYCRPPRSLTGLPGQTHMVTSDQWNDLYRNSRVCQQSFDRRVPGPLAMRALWVLLYFCGPRTRDAFLLPREGVSLSPRCPIAEWRCDWPHGWIWFVATKTRKLHLIPMHPVLATHLRRVYELRFGDPPPLEQSVRGLQRALDALRKGRDVEPDPSRALLPLGGATEQQRKEWQTYRRLVQAAAGTEPAEMLEYRDLREACNMAWNRAHYPAGQWILGHASTGVNETYYTVGVQYMLDALPKLTVPEAFGACVD